MTMQARTPGSSIISEKMMRSAAPDLAAPRPPPPPTHTAGPSVIRSRKAHCFGCRPISTRLLLIDALQCENKRAAVGATYFLLDLLAILLGSQLAGTLQQCLHNQF